MDIKNSFLADAINTLAELGKKAAAPTFHDVNGRTFLVTGSDYTEIEPPELPKPEKVITRSLDAQPVHRSAPLHFLRQRKHRGSIHQAEPRR